MLAVLLCLTNGSFNAEGPDWTANQRLILACFELDVPQVVRMLRAGADVNAEFGVCEVDAEIFVNRWTNEPCDHCNLTALQAVTIADELPPPPTEFGDVSQHPELEKKAKAAIPENEISSRREREAMIMNLLISHKCRLDPTDHRGATPLYNAADADKEKLVQLLLEHGANPNTRTGIYLDGSGDTTPLHVAAPSRKIMSLLLKYGADPTAKDTSGHTPVDWLNRSQKRASQIVRINGKWTIVDPE